jgi:hypothetical protein
VIISPALFAALLISIHCRDRNISIFEGIPLCRGTEPGLLLQKFAGRSRIFFKVFKEVVLSSAIEKFQEYQNKEQQ